MTLKMDVTRYFKISGTIHSATRRHIPEGCNLHENTCWPPMYPACLRNTNCLKYFLTFICPCIASISLKYNQKGATFSLSIYFSKLLYMFQAVPPPIIRSTKLYIQRQVLSNQCCCYRGWNGTEFHVIHGSSRQQYWFDNTWRCMYSSVLLMMGGGTAWNMQSNL